MKKFNLLFISPVIIFATSCMPAVKTTVLKSYPPFPPDSVVVYTKKYQVPDNPEILGQVRVYDSGTSMHCDSLTVVSYVRLETGKMGGNAALITDHIRPSFWGSTCHQMTATTMRVNNPTSKDSMTLFVGETMLGKPLRKLPHARMAANIGYGWRTAKIPSSLSSDERKHVEQLKSGLVWEVSAAYFFSDWSGLALEYAGYRATASSPGYFIDAPHITGTVRTTDLMTYIGPAWVTRFSQRQTWIWECSFGLGYLAYTSKSMLRNKESKVAGSTLGSKVTIGGEYKFAKNWGFGANIQVLGGVLSEETITDMNGVKSTVEFKEDEGEGLGHIRLQVGLRYYIK